MQQVIRRDRRAEWIMRNRLHPMHAQYVIAPDSETGPNGLIRRYPHRVGFIGPNGVKRIDRLNRNSMVSSTVSQLTTASQTLPLHQIIDPAIHLLVVPDMPGGRMSSHDKDILGQAQQIASQLLAETAVVAVVFGHCKETQFELAGVDRIIHIEGEQYDGYCPEEKTQCLVAIDQQLRPEHWLFPDSKSGGFEIGARLAAQLGERPATHVWQVNEEFILSRGASGKTDIKRSIPKILLLDEECALPVEDTRHETKAIGNLCYEESAGLIEDLGLVAVDPQAVPLVEAEFILSAGNGIHDWEQFHQAATVLGATEGASRVAVDDGFMPRHRQVGATGSWVTARVYLAVGISGAIQHLQGIGACDKVVAVNTDPGCDMVKRADLSVIADSHELLSELIHLMEEYQRQELPDAA